MKEIKSTIELGICFLYILVGVLKEKQLPPNGK